MKLARSIIVTASLATTACAPDAETGDEDADYLINLVVRSEAPFHQCIEIGPETLVVDYPEDYPAPIMGPYPGAFSDAEANSAAFKLAVKVDRLSGQAESTETATVIGDPDTIDGTGSCSMRVHYPIFAQDYAFMEFSAPGGDIGAYAFKRTSAGWRVAERLHFGWW